MANWALIVGINNYAKLPAELQLHGAVADAADFADWALHAQGGGVDPERFFMWTYPPPPADSRGPLGPMTLSGEWRGADPEPTRAPNVVDIVGKVGELLDAVTFSAEAHRIYVFFAGHGVQLNPARPETCFITGDFEQVSNLGLIPCESLRVTLTTSGFSEVVMFLDCCRTQLNVRTSIPTVFDPGAQQPVMHAVGHAAGRGTRAFEIPSGTPARGAFTSAVTEGLRRVRDANGVLTVNALEAYVYNRVPTLMTGTDKQYPQFEIDPRNPAYTLIEGPVIETLADLTVTNVPAGAQIQLFDSNNAPIGAPHAETGGTVVFHVPLGSSYAIGLVGGNILDLVRFASAGEPHALP